MYLHLGETSEQDVSEARTHSIKVSVTNSEGVASGMYAMDDAIVTKQDDGTYLVKMHQASENRNYMALVNGTTADDIAAATQHKIDWYVADSSYYYTIPVASLSDTVYASFSKTTNVNKGQNGAMSRPSLLTPPPWQILTRTMLMLPA